MSNNDNGIWRTVGGRRIFIKTGQSLSEAMKESGKFPSQKDNEYAAIGEHYRLLKEKLTEKTKDGTYNLETGEIAEFGDGFQVSFEQSTDNYSNAEYGKIIHECSVKCDGNVYGGIFGGNPEISFHTDNEKTAIKIAKKYNQHSYYRFTTDEKHPDHIVKNPEYNSSKNKVNI